MLAYQSMAQDVRTMDLEGRMPSTNANDMTPKSTAATQSSLPSGHLSNDVSSLRALALSTLRPRRRKDIGGAPLTPSKPLPSRPAALDSNAIFLDYGSEVKEDHDAPIASASTTNDITENRPATSQTVVDEEVKEEGEISDEEPRASSIASSSSPADGVKNSFSYASRNAVSTQPAVLPSSRSIDSEPLRSPPDRDLWNNWVPTEDHVRPGLKMNMGQFNLVKELILDLLGWGVAPEYLVDCGLTREAVFYAFTELNLRLPKNLDVTGLLPLPRDNAAINAPLRLLSQPLANDTTIPPSSLPSKPEISPIDAGNSSMSHPLPAKPLAPAASSASSTASTVPATPTHPNGQNLSDMEAQKRQELLARKAILDSRRKKTLPTSSGELSVSQTSSTTSRVLGGSIVDEPASIAPTSAVDDFLKNVMETTAPSSQSSTPTAMVTKARTLSGGVALGVPSGATATPTVAKKSPATSTFPDAMEVDSGSIPGLGPPPSRSASTKSESLTAPTSGSADASVPVVPTPLSALGVIRRTASRSSTGHVPPSAPLVDRRPKLGSIPGSPAPPSMTNGRRGTKRPVAMDFVDIDDNQTGSQSESVPPPFIRRKLGGFAGLGGHVHRKCVIDLSDSEDDENGYATNERQAPNDDEATISANRNITHAATTPTPTPRPQITRPSSSIGMVSTISRLSPEALAEKERQIKQMREMIAKREQVRLRKLAEKSRTPVATPPPTSSSSVQARTDLATTSIPVAVEPEETDSPILSSATSTATFESVGQPSRSESSSSSNDQADEDIVMQTLEVPGSTSEFALPTPTDIKTIALEHCTTGEAEEAREEPGDRPDKSEGTTLAMPVDVAKPDTSSAQIDSPQDSFSLYTEYNSPFSSYPLLRSRSRVVSDLALDAHLSSSSSLTSAASPFPSSASTLVASKIVIPDLRPLRVAVMSREAGSGGGRRICQFEVPGGGECRDKTCTDLHLGDLEPDDHETARYLLETIPDILKGYDESEVADQLVQAKQKKSGLVKTSTQTTSTALEDRVAEAIAALVGSER